MFAEKSDSLTVGFHCENLNLSGQQYNLFTGQNGDKVAFCSPGLQIKIKYKKCDNQPQLPLFDIQIIEGY